MRQFFAIPLPEKVRKEIDRKSEPFRGMKELKNVKSRNLHLTLLFLGDKGTDNELARVREIPFKPFNLSTTNISIFPERKPRLVWLDLAETDELVALHRRLSRIYDMDEVLKAHITLARIKWPAGELKQILREKADAANPCEFGFRVDHFNLYNSELKPDGPVYRLVESFPASPED